MITRLARRAKLPTEIAHPHSLRHGRVMHILEAAAAKPNFRPELLIPTLAQYLGHAQATTTIQHYMSITSGVAAVNEELLDDIFGEDEE
jgi:integrase